MHADLDTLVIALYVMVDDLVGPRCGPGRPPKLSDSDVQRIKDAVKEDGKKP